MGTPIENPQGLLLSGKEHGSSTDGDGPEGHFFGPGIAHGGWLAEEMNAFLTKHNLSLDDSHWTPSSLASKAEGCSLSAELLKRNASLTVLGQVHHHFPSSNNRTCLFPTHGTASLNAVSVSPFQQRRERHQKRRSFNDRSSAPDQRRLPQASPPPLSLCQQRHLLCFQCAFQLH